jgi:1,4-alpha-glucan branching enzyme
MSGATRGSTGELALVLHTHMPYVEGFGTWPFGEEWLWEAIAGCYLPLLEVLGRAPITLSLTPVLCDQLEAPGAMERCLAFLGEIRPESHRRDAAHLREAGQTRLLAEVQRSSAEYAAAVQRLGELVTARQGGGGGLIAALGRHVSWTSAATHAVLPLVATDAGVALQVQTGLASHRRRFGDWAGGFWLPECAYAPWLDYAFAQAGVRATCVELTAAFGLRSVKHLRPLATDEGLVLWPLDRWTVDLVWGERGYPASPAYRDYHHRTAHDHRLWRNDGDPYDPLAARALTAEHARDFVARVRERVAGGGVCVCAVDTELLGHWWYEGLLWLQAVIDEASRQRLALTTLDDALDRHEPLPVPGDGVPPISSWGEGEDLRTWSGPAVADLAWQARSAELRTVAHGAEPGDRALRELLALQSSDWAFLASKEIAGDYPRERAVGHANALAAALASEHALGATDSGAAHHSPAAPKLRNLAPDLAGWVG